MGVTLKRYKLKLNSIEKMEELLQELYDESCKNIEEIQIQMNKLSNSVQLNEESIDGKTKYAKAMNDFVTNKDKAIGRKLEIAKLMGEVIKYHGNIKNAQENSEIFGNFNWAEIQEQMAEEDDDKTKKYKLK